MKYVNYIVAVAIVAVAGVQAYADAPEDKMILTSGTNKTEIPVNTISRIIFDGNTMKVATSGAADQTFDVLALDNIKFDLKANAGETINRVFDDGVTINVNGGVIDVIAGDGAPVQVAVYNLSGVCVLQSAGAGAVSVDMNPLAHGIYIVKANNKTVKFIR